MKDEVSDLDIIPKLPGDVKAKIVTFEGKEKPVQTDFRDAAKLSAIGKELLLAKVSAHGEHIVSGLLKQDPLATEKKALFEAARTVEEKSGGTLKGTDLRKPSAPELTTGEAKPLGMTKTFFRGEGLSKTPVEEKEKAFEVGDEVIYRNPRIPSCPGVVVKVQSGWVTVKLEHGQEIVEPPRLVAAHCTHVAKVNQAPAILAIQCVAGSKGSLYPKYMIAIKRASDLTEFQKGYVVRSIEVLAEQLDSQSVDFADQLILMVEAYANKK